MIKKKIWLLNQLSEDIQSVNSISLNLVKLYHSLSRDQFIVTEINVANLTMAQSLDSNLHELVAEFRREPPDKIVIVHPGIMDHVFLRALLSIKTENNPQFIFHVFGNFVRYGLNWFSLGHLLAKKNIHFFVASKSYLKLLSHFIAKENLVLFPFPIEASFLKKERSPVGNNKTLGDLKLMYAGRFHQQKNITQVIEALGVYCEEYGRKIDLNLVVYFDDFNPSTLETKKILGRQYKTFCKAMTKKSALLNITLLPHQNAEELGKLYAKSDAFISFSTFFDEDYGMAILEALSSGTPCLLSNWGGYNSFIEAFPDECFGLDVTLEGDEFLLDLGHLPVYLNKISTMPEAQREQLIEKTRQFIGQDTLLRKLEILFGKVSFFGEFNNNFLNFSNELKKETAGFKNDFIKYYKTFWVHDEK